MVPTSMMLVLPWGVTMELFGRVPSGVIWARAECPKVANALLIAIKLANPKCQYQPFEIVAISEFTSTHNRSGHEPKSTANCSGLLSKLLVLP